MNRRELLKTSSLMLGYTLTGSTAIAVLNGCKADTSVDWTPVNLGTEEYKLVSALAETIIPATDTPGALDAGVDRFIDALLTAFDDQGMTNYKSAISRVDNLCLEKFNKSFYDCKEDQKNVILNALINGDKDDRAAFREIRESVLVGFCISEIGSNQFFNYDPIPGAPYQGCIEFSEAGKTWALSDENIRNIFIN